MLKWSCLPLGNSAGKFCSDLSWVTDSDIILDINNGLDTHTKLFGFKWGAKRKGEVEGCVEVLGLRCGVMSRRRSHDTERSW